MAHGSRHRLKSESRGEQRLGCWRHFKLNVKGSQEIQLLGTLKVVVFDSENSSNVAILDDSKIKKIGKCYTSSKTWSLFRGCECDVHDKFPPCNCVRFNFT